MLMPAISITIDGQDWTSRVEGLTFSNSDPGGYEACSFTLPGEQRINLGAPIVIRDGLEVCWLGRVAEGGLAHDGQASTTRVQGEGAQAALTDSVMAMIYVDTSFTAWQPVSIARRKVFVELPWVANDGAVGNDQAGVPALVTAFDGTGLAAERHITQQEYDAGQACYIALIQYGWKRSTTVAAGPDANWQWTVGYVPARDDTAAFTTSGDLQATGPGFGSLAASGQIALVELDYQGAAALGAATQYAIYWTALGVYGNHGLPLSGDALSASNPTYPQGIDPSLIAADAAKRAGLAVGPCPPSGFINRQASYRDYVPHQQIIAEQAALVGWHWGVWAGGNAFDPRPEFRFAPPASEATAQVARGDCSGMDTASRLADLYNIFLAASEDPAAGKGWASVAQDNPALPAGVTRVKNVGGVSGNALAAQAYARLQGLLATSSSRAAGSVRLPRGVREPGGGTRPAHLLRAGVDRLRVTGLPGVRDLLAADTRAIDTFRIKRVETTIGTAGVPQTSCELDEGADLLEVLAARQANAPG